MDAPLIVSISGIRGIVGRSLTPNVVADFAATYGTHLSGQTVVVSRDGRGSGDMFGHAAIAGLTAAGCRVVDIGISATPTCGFYVKSIGAGGGIQITASHNPPEWNGLKLFRREGFVLSPADGKKIADSYSAGQRTLVEWNKLQNAVFENDPHRPHLEAVLKQVDVDAIRRRRFRVVLDANHGSGATFGPRLLEMLGCQFEVLGADPDGKFEHPPEPTEANLSGFRSKVLAAGADIGFATDPDADRLAIVDNEGRYIGEEYTLALAIRRRVMDKQGPVVLNGSTSRVSEDVAKQAGCTVCRTPVGEVHVAERIIRENALIGGEGNGGVIDPRIGYIRDSAIGMAVVLDLLVKEDRPLSAVVREMPAYAIQKDKYPADRDRLPQIFEAICRTWPNASVDRSDGLRLEWPDSWVQLRASNTEPIVRVIAEAKTAERAAELCRKVGELVR